MLWCIVTGLFLANVRDSSDEELPFGPEDITKFYTYMMSNEFANMYTKISY